MSIGIQYSVAGRGGSSAVTSVAGSVFHQARQIIRRRKEQSRLRAVSAGIVTVNAHTLKDIGADRDALLWIAGTTGGGSDLETRPGGLNDVRA